MASLLLASKLQGTFALAKSRFPKPVEQCNILCITTAANSYAADKRDWLDDELNAVRAAGANLDIYDIAGKTAQEVSAKFARADIIYITGGKPYYLLAHMQQCRFGALLQVFLARGGIYIGSSAGAVVACPRINFIGTMDNPEFTSHMSLKGLSLVPFLVMPHLDNPKYAETARNLLREVPPHETAFALRDNQALWVTGNVVELIQA